MSYIEPFDAALIDLYASRVDWNRYRTLVELAAMSGDDRARYAMATWYLHGHEELRVRRNPKRARELLLLAARSSALAMCDLAFAYETGKLGFTRDPRRAYALYRRAARFGSIGARFDVGRCLVHGIGVRQDRQRGERVLQDAARLGYDDPTPARRSSRPARRANPAERSPRRAR